MGKELGNERRWSYLGDKLRYIMNELEIEVSRYGTINQLEFLDRIYCIVIDFTYYLGEYSLNLIIRAAGELP